MFKSKIITDEIRIDQILDRYTEEILPKREDLKKKLLSGKRLKIYIGADPTGSNLHLGHATNFFLLEEFRKLGHEVIILFGGFTAMIGDPTGKEAERIRLSPKDVSENIKSWKEQVSKAVDFNDFFNKPKIVNNNDWYSKMGLEEIINISSNFTVQQMIERDMFEKRIKGGKPVFVHEFFYPFLQGYDSVVLDVDIEIGGTDQTFNMLAGRTLVERFKKKEKFVISTPLFENPKTGEKLMNKSTGQYIAILEEPNNMFGKVMAMPDEVIVDILKYSTKADLNKIKEVEDLISSDPKKVKQEVALEVVKTYHNEKFANKAKENWDKTFSKKEVTEDLLEYEVEKEKKLIELVIEKEIVSSKSEFRRLVDAGAVSEFNGDKISDPNYQLIKDQVLKVGKKNIFKVKVK